MATEMAAAMTGIDKQRNVLLRIAYDGSGFHGWQIQPNARTVQGVLEETISLLVGAPTRPEGTSRTDAGVHALGQCATIRGAFAIPTERIPLAMNDRLSDIRVLSAEEKPEDFHARFSALGKTYLYRFAVSPAPSVFLRNYVSPLPADPNVDKMNEAARALIGTKDFACFQAAGGAPRETTVRTIRNAGVFEKTGTDFAGNQYKMIEIVVTGDGFLYNMVRIIAGTLADVGLGKLAPSAMNEIIASQKRARAGATAPPQGLYLKEVYFNE